MRDDPIAGLAVSSGAPLVVTRRGEVPVAQLEPGDMVLTRDNGLRPVRRVVELCDHATPAVIMAAGSLGQGVPHRDTRLSETHRVLVTGEIAALLFDMPEALVEVRHLRGLAGIAPAESAPRVIDVACDDDETIMINGCWFACRCDAPAPGGVTGHDPEIARQDGDSSPTAVRA
jgi:hypothetical protein